MLSDFLLHQRVKESSWLGPALFWMSPSEAKKLAVMWKEVLYQSGLWGRGRPCTGNCLLITLCGLLSTSTVSSLAHTHAVYIHLLTSYVSHPLRESGSPPPVGEGPRGCWPLRRGPGYGHLGHVTRHKSDKNGGPISLTYIAKPCVDIDTYQGMAWRDRAWFVYKLNTNQRFITFLMRFSLILLFYSEHGFPCLTLTFCNN